MKIVNEFVNAPIAISIFDAGMTFGVWLTDCDRYIAMFPVRIMAERFIGDSERCIKHAEIHDLRKQHKVHVWRKASQSPKEKAVNLKAKRAPRYSARYAEKVITHSQPSALNKI